MYHYRYLVAGITAAAVLIAIVVSLTMTPIYRAEIVVSEQREGDALGPLLGALPAQLATLGFGRMQGGQTDAMAILQSRMLVERFIVEHDLLPVLSEGVDQPSLWLAVNRVRDSIMSISRDPGTGLITVSAEWTDPALAARWANDFVSLADSVIRERARQDAAQSIAFLEEQIERSNVVELRTVLYGLVEEQMKRSMLVHAKEYFAFEIIDPAVPPEMRARPKRTMMVVLAAIIGGVLGMLAALILYPLREELRLRRMSR